MKLLKWALLSPPHNCLLKSPETQTHLSALFNGCDLFQPVFFIFWGQKQSFSLMCTTLFQMHSVAGRPTASIAKQQQKHTGTTDTGQGSLLYSNLLSEIKWSVQITKKLDPQNERTTTDLKKKELFTSWQKQKLLGTRTRFLTSSCANVISWDCSVCTDRHTG